MNQPRTAPTADDLVAMAEDALRTIPDELRRHVGNVVIKVEEFPDEDVEREMELESPFDLLGLYSGVDMINQSLAAPRTSMDMIFLYRRPILDYWCDSGEDLYHLVRHVLIHEIGHHFGFSDDDMEALEEQADEGSPDGAA